MIERTLRALAPVFAAAVLSTEARAGETPHGAHAAPPTAGAAMLFDDLGSHSHPVTTRSPQAQAYFDQGLRLIYAFNHDEAIRSFHEAARLDPECAMAWWGVAFAYGPNYNLPLDDERNRKAVEAMERAVALAPKASPAERDYIAAVQRRYSLDPKADRKQLDRDFAGAMRALAQKYPDDLDAATLFAESLMDLRPWDLWTADGKPQPGTEEIVATLEGVLRRSPNHPGANHYYIHAIEASPEPSRGVPSAQRLEKLVPGAGHLVHMPSHIYMRIGRYSDATEANRKAIEVDRRYLERAKPEGVYPMMYYPHNIHFLVAAASMEGRSADAISAARDLVAQLDPEGMRQMPMLEYFSPTLLFTLARFGRWQEVLAQPAPPDDLAYSRALWAYARGLAFAAQGNLEQAQAQLALLRAATEAMPADRIVGDNTPARKLLQLAQHVLAGEMAARQGNTEEALRQLRAAVQLQDELPYTEPPPWYYPVRQSLAQVLLDGGRPAEAAEIYREDLARNPENGWSLYGLSRALDAAGQKAPAYQTDLRFRSAWARADVVLKKESGGR
jgi:tetratricopeptide (TPR) repeat protein